MSLNRFAAKIDSAQREIVKQLRGCGIQVWMIKKPCDLLLRFWCNRHQDFCWQTMEVKTPYGKTGPKARIRVDGAYAGQTKFLQETSTPVATTFDEAWKKLNQQHSLGRIDSPSPLQPIRHPETSCPPKSA